MTTTRITRIVEIVHLWKFLQEGISYESKYFRYAHDMEVYRRMLCSLVKAGDKAWVSVAFEDGEPRGFIMAHDVTPLHATVKEFDIAMFYFQPGFKHSIRLLQNEFDSFCRRNGISHYYLTTSSRCGSAARIFNQTWRGLEHSNTVFRRVVNNSHATL